MTLSPVEERQLLEVSLRLEELQLPTSPTEPQAYGTPRGYGWLGDHQDEAAELAALLHEAAPRLALASLRPAPGSGGLRPKLPKARSYELMPDSTKDRLRAAVPLPLGPGQLDWSRLTAAISSELLSFDEASDVALARAHSLRGETAAAAAADAAAALPGGMLSPGGERLEINSGGRVIFLLFAPPGQPASPVRTPPSSLLNSPDKRGPPSFIHRAAGGTAGGAGGGGGGTPAVRSPLGAAGLAAAVPNGWESPCRRPSFEDGLLPGGISAADAGAEERAAALCAVAASALASAPAAAAAAAAAHPLTVDVDLPGGETAAEMLHRAAGSFSFPRPGSLSRSNSAPPSPTLRRQGSPSPEGCIVLKFVSSRLLCQSEQFASELTRHVGLSCPDSRILRSEGATAAEWREAYEAAAVLRDRGFPDLREEMSRNSCCLVMEYIPGQCLFKALPGLAAAGPASLAAAAADLGRLFTLDMLLGNADRLPCRELSWRGNPENLLFASSGRWAGRAVAIDAVVQRRPPGGLMSVEDGACERLAELALNDGDVAGALLRQALQPCGDAAAAIPAAAMRDAAAAFQQGLKAALEAVASIKGLLEMMFEVVSEWIEAFLQDIESASSSSSAAALTPSAHQHVAAPPLSTPKSAAAPRRASSAGGAPSPLMLTASAATSAQTMRIRQISEAAQKNDSVGERVKHWKAVFREKGEELRAAVEEWQLKRGTPAQGGQRLTTAFLDGTHPVVDVYELKVRLEHMLQRLRVLQQAMQTGRPTRLLRHLYVSGAVEASSLHLLRHLGITHVLNATEDLLLPEEGLGFVTHRVPLRDVEEEDISPHLPDASAFIDAALASGGAVLVHCHAGRSRSCSLVLAWLMTAHRWPLNRALEFMQRARPQAAPNAGYLAALLRLEEELFGRQTVKMRKTKPEPRCCPECGDKVGLSAESVRVHLRLKHPASALARAMGDSGSGAWLDSPVGGSSPPSPALGSGGAQPSPLGAAPDDQQQQARQQPEDATEGAAGEGFPLLSPPRIATARSRAAQLAAEEEEAALPESPPSMAAALRGQPRGLSLLAEDADAEEAFLAAASSSGEAPLV